MTTTIGAFDAKAKLSELLREVQLGHRYVITVRGKPIADLVPSGSHRMSATRNAVESMRNIRKIVGVDAQTVTEWIADGRR